MTWLVSYPRSGSTLTRILCWQVFGIKSTNDCPESPLEEQLGTICEGIVPYGTIDKEPFLIKTHQQINTTEKVIYIVRNVRACYISKYHFYTLQGSLKENILNNPLFNSEKRGWSKSLDFWQPLTRPDTLLIKYEDIVANSTKVIIDLYKFLGVKAKDKWYNNFEELHSKLPDYFREGTIDSWKKEWNDELEQIVLKQDGNWITKLGY